MSYNIDRIVGVMVSVLDSRVRWIVGSSPDRDIQQTIKLVLVVSPQSTQL